MMPNGLRDQTIAEFKSDNLQSGLKSDFPDLKPDFSPAKNPGLECGLEGEKSNLSPKSEIVIFSLKTLQKRQKNLNFSKIFLNFFQKFQIQYFFGLSSNF